MRYQRAAQPLKLDGLEAARAFFADCFTESDPARECLWVALVDADWNCLHLSRHEGGETGGALPLRAIIAGAASHEATGILLAHNHPSGDPRPSESDVLATRRLACAADGMDCILVDHFIFAGAAWTSFRCLGLL
jgi:DNA repair protein RadC